MTAVHASYLSGPNVTDADRKTAGLTDMTDVLPFPVMTHDRSSLVRPLYARTGEGNRGPAAHLSSTPPPTPRRPPWLYDGPLTNRVRVTGCRRCRRPVLEALASDCIPTQVDLIRLTPAAELHHLIAGGLTLRLWPDRPNATALHLAFRMARHIRAAPGRGLPMHDCAITHGPNDPTILAAPARRATLPEEPPF